MYVFSFVSFVVYIIGVPLKDRLQWELGGGEVRGSLLVSSVIGQNVIYHLIPT